MAAATSPPTGWVLSQLSAADLGLDDVRGALSARAVVEGNGCDWTAAAIDSWIMRNNGERFAYDERQPFDTARKLGWAHFGQLDSAKPRSQIWLPLGQRPTVVKMTTPIVASRWAGMSWKGWAAVAAVVLVGGSAAMGAFSDDDEKQRRRG